MTLASIVEKETGKPEERPRVAGVFINRLEKHMRLGSDPTIVYGLVQGKGTLGRSITKADLNQSTPYNTYIIDGLPPGPICNPGKAALEAVAKPARSKDLYFVADGTGGHAFAETLDQHQKNVARWRQIEKDVKDKLAPDVTPGPAIRGSIDPVDPAQFGALVAPGQGQAPPSVLARLEQNRRGPEHERGSARSSRQASNRSGNEGRRPLAPKSGRQKALAGGEGDSGPASVSSSPQFGSLVAPAQGQVASASVLARLSKIGADRNAKDAALASLAAPGAKTIEELGAVVAGVNDAPAEGLAFGDDDPPATGAGPVASAPLSPAMLADQKAREAKYGTATLASTTLADTAAAAPAQASPGTASGRPRIYDASEGTPLDPLLNKTYDLSYAKVVPADALTK